MINSTKKERPELFTKELIDDVYEMFRSAVKLESEWGAYITQGQILGLTDEIIEPVYPASCRQKTACSRAGKDL